MGPLDTVSMSKRYIYYTLMARVHKDFQNKVQDQAQVKHSYIMDFFKTYYNYLTIDRWCLIQYVLRTRHLGILSFFIN